MKKLEDIPKKDLFKAPDGYFDSLPGIIQARVSKPRHEQWWSQKVSHSLRYALPLVVIGVASYFYLNRPSDESTEDVLASVDSASLVSYLEDSDINTDDLLDTVPLSSEEINAIHESSMEEIDVNDVDADYLSTELGIENL